MKKLIVFLVLLMPMIVIAQNNEIASSSKQTTFEKFSSTIGTIVKFKDYKLTSVSSKIGSGLAATHYTVRAEVRQLIIDNNKTLFLHLTYQGYQEPKRSAFIAMEDVVEIEKALTELIKQCESDSTGDAYYLENKFSTKDNFDIGYYIETTVDKKGEESNELRWYVTLDDRYNHSTAFFLEPDGLRDLFKTAIQKMNELK